MHLVASVTSVVLMMIRFFALTQNDKLTVSSDA